MPWYSDLKESLSRTSRHDPRNPLDADERHVRIGHVPLTLWPFKVKEMRQADGLMPTRETGSRGAERIRHHGTTELNHPGEASSITSIRRSNEGDKVADNERSPLQELHAQLADAPNMQKFVADVIASGDPVHGPLLEAIARKRPLTKEFFENADDPARLVARAFHATGFTEPGTSVLRDDGVAHAVARIMYEDMLASDPAGAGTTLFQGTAQDLTTFRSTQLKSWAGASSARQRVLLGWIEQQLSAASCPSGYTPHGWASRIAGYALERFDYCIQASLRLRLRQHVGMSSHECGLDPKAIPGHLPLVSQMIARAVERNDGKLASIVQGLFPDRGGGWDDSTLALGNSPERWVARALANDRDVFTRFALRGLEVTVEGCTAYAKHRLEGSNSTVLDMHRIGASLHASLRARLEMETPPNPEIADLPKPEASEQSKVVEAPDSKNSLDGMQALIDEAPEQSPVRDFLADALATNDDVLLALLKNLAPETERVDLHGLGGVSSVGELLARCFTSDRFRSLAGPVAEVVYRNLSLDYPQGDKLAPALVEEQIKNAGFLDRYAGRRTHRQAVLAGWMHERLKHARSLTEDAARDLANEAAQSALPTFDAQVSDLSAVNAQWKGFRDWMKDVTLGSVPTGHRDVRDFIQRVVENKDAAVAQALRVLFPRAGHPSAHPALAGETDPRRLLGLALAADPAVRTRMALVGLTGSLNDCEAYVGNLLHKSTLDLHPTVVAAFVEMAGRTLHEQLHAAQGEGKQVEDGKPNADAT